jgi:Met-zincin
MAMNQKSYRAFVGLTLLVLFVASGGCVAQRPSRNGVFNENQYVRKDFLTRAGDGGQDPGWMLKATVTDVSTPDPLGDVFGIFAGSESGGALVRFVVTQDKLQMVNMREMTSAPSAGRIPEVVNAWPITNVDLKYRINLDGEKTNFYEENQELDWQVRQWVKINFAKNDMSDVAPLGDFTSDLLSRCTDIGNASATLVPNSFVVDEPADYMQWQVQIALPLKWDDEACVTAYGELGETALRLGRQTVTFNLLYSMVRSKLPAQMTYKPLEVAEKDPIRHKYGPIEYTTISRDEASGQLAARQLVIRFDPEKPIVWYFAQGFPEQYKAVFTGPGGVAEQTNKLLSDANVKARVSFKNFDEDLGLNQAPREYGDVRYSFLRWISDRDMQSYWAGVTQFVVDPRTGEAVSSSISFNDFAIKDYYVQRLDAFLQMLGASNDVNSSNDWPDAGPCKDGDTMPIAQADVVANHNGNSSLYQKMQQYLQKPAGTYGNLGPQDFIASQDADFFHAYYALSPYYVFADPDMNPFVVPEGGAGVLGPGEIWKLMKQEADWRAITRSIDRGEAPYTDVTGPSGLQNATSFLNHFKELTLAHKDLMYRKNFIHRNMHLDTPDAFSFESVVARDARHCINGKWESKTDWVQNLIYTYWSQVMWHEFGHSLGLEHNFMASIDATNFPHYKDGQGKDHVGLNASSVMEYNASPDRVFWHAGWAPYDEGAISWIYANTAPTAPPDGAVAAGISGQVSKTAPWNDPKGFAADGKGEIQFLYCNEYHLKYTPFCRQGDLGRTPSEIMANAIDSYEWQYQWRNFRTYRKIWDNTYYADGPAGMIVDMRRFLSLWAFDWSTGELADTMRRIGIKNPDPNGSDQEYFGQLTNKFNAEVSTANQMVAAFHKAIIQQSSGERPYRTIYDKYYGDVTQQGIILDKLFAMQGWTALWPTENYDPNQAGSYIASYSGLGDSSYDYIAGDTVNSMIGGQYDVYPYFVPLAVAQFAQDTHSPSFSGYPQVRDWIGGHTFTRLQDFLDYFRDLAVQNNYAGCDTFAQCTYDPRPLSDTHNEFFGPDLRKWIWAYIADRNQWVAVQKERNTASYVIVRNYTDDVIYQLDDGGFPGGAYNTQLPMKFFLDSFTYFN